MDPISFGYISKWLQSCASGHNRSREEEKTGNVALRFFEGVFEIFQSFISFLGSIIGSSKSSTDQKTTAVAGETGLWEDDFEVLDESSDEEVFVDSNRLSAIENLKGDGLISDNTVMQALEHFEVSYLKEFISPENIKDMNNLRSNESGVVFIPVVLKGLVRDHIVLFTVDHPNKLIEFYDSQGTEVNGRNIKKDPSKNLLTIENEIQEALQGYNTLKPNTNKQQPDHVNCGAFVLRYVQERQTRSFDEICADDNIDIAVFRKDLAETLLPDQKSA